MLMDWIFEVVCGEENEVLHLISTISHVKLSKGFHHHGTGLLA